MPFDPYFPRSFVSSEIHLYAPAMPGVYGITNASEWIYIGQSDNIQGALGQHLQDVNASLWKRRPTGFVYEACEGDGRRNRYDRLIREYKPTCNGSPVRHANQRVKER